MKDISPKQLDSVLMEAVPVKSGRMTQPKDDMSSLDLC